MDEQQIGPTGPFAPIEAVPIDELVGNRDWGEVYEDVMALLEQYNHLMSMAVDGTNYVPGAVRAATKKIIELEEALDISWDGERPFVPRPRLWRYRVC